MLKILKTLLALGLLFLFLPSAACAERNRMLETALSFLEEDCPFLRRYNEAEGTDIRALCPLGCPYFYGGYNTGHLLKPAHPDHESDYYRKENLYLYGMDCSGFTRYIVEQAGYERHPRTSALINPALYTGYLLPGAKEATGKDRASRLKTGDLLVIQHQAGGYHMAMYCGTLRDFGYGADTVPEELAPYLDYPLLIHSTGSSVYHERYRRYIEEQLGRTDIVPPYGGVIVTVLDVPPSAAPDRTPEAGGLERPCFVLEGYCLQVTDLAQEKYYRWLRWRQRPEN